MDYATCLIIERKLELSKSIGQKFEPRIFFGVVAFSASHFKQDSPDIVWHILGHKPLACRRFLIHKLGANFSGYAIAHPSLHN